MTHVDEWLDMPSFDDDGEIYAKFVLDYCRMPAWKKHAYAKWMSQYKLFCTYDGQRFRCNGASRLGDVWLTPDYEQASGYKLRVDVKKCSEWSDNPNHELSAARQRCEALVKERDDIKALYEAGCAQWNPVYQVVVERAERANACIREVSRIITGEDYTRWLEKHAEAIKDAARSDAGENAVPRAQDNAGDGSDASSQTRYKPAGTAPDHTKGAAELADRLEEKAAYLRHQYPVIAEIMVEAATALRALKSAPNEMAEMPMITEEGMEEPNIHKI